MEDVFVEMRMISGLGYTALHIGHTNGDNIVTGYITSLETGIYNVDIFDINNNGQKDSSGTAVYNINSTSLSTLTTKSTYTYRCV